MMPKRGMSITTMATGAVVAGAMCGGVEALWRHGPVLYAALMYGAAAGSGALAAGIAGAPWWRGLRAMPFTVGFTTVAGLTAGILARFALWRDVFLEAPALRARATVGGCAAALAVGAAAFLAARIIERHAGPALRRMRSLPWVVAALFFSYGWYAPLLAEPGRAPTPDAAPDADAGAGAGTTPSGAVLVVMDALRADAVGALRNGASATPHLDALRAESVDFAHTSAQASWTKPAMATVLTSQHVHTHRTMSKTAVLPPEAVTIASVLRDHRIPALAVVTNYNLASIFGFATGFDTFEYLAPDRYLNAPVEATRLSAYNVYRLVRERVHRRRHEARFFYQPATAVNARALRWLDARREAPHAAEAPQPYFMWLHYMEAHDPYVADDGAAFARVSEPHPRPEDAPAMHAAYLDSVHRADAALGALVAELKARGVYDTTLLVVTADHGEEFGEHGDFYHGTSLYESLLHVPLVMHVPGVAAKRVVDLARQVDIAPTLAGFFNIQPPLTFEGRDLLAPGAPPRQQVALAEEDHQGHVLRAMRWRNTDPNGPGDATRKLIVANPGNPRGLPTEAWFDLAQDPREEHPVTLEQSVAQRDRQQLQRALGSKGVARVPDVERPLDVADEAALRALGYVQ